MKSHTAKKKRCKSTSQKSIRYLKFPVLNEKTSNTKDEKRIISQLMFTGANNKLIKADRVNVYILEMIWA